MKKFIFKSEILGHLAHWAVRLSSYIPDYLPSLLKAADDYLTTNPLGEILIDTIAGTMYDYTDTNVYSYVHKMVHEVPEIAILNLRKEEIAAGLTAVDDVIGDSGRRFRPHDKSSSFVDLGALARNISNSIEREYEWNRASDLRIEKAIKL